MGFLKQELIDLEDYSDNEVEEKIYKQMIKNEVYDIIDKSPTSKTDNLKRFLSNVLPYDSKNKYYFLVKKYDTTKDFFFKYNKYIKALELLSEQEYDIYYSLTFYDGWHKEENANACKAIFIDIDDFNIDITDFELNDIIKMLINEYSVDEEHLPNYIVKSGHGIHLYYLIEETYDKSFREPHINQMITFFKADISCRILSHYIRVPLSYNCKGKPIKSKLYEVNPNKTFYKDDLNFFYKTEEEICDYFLKKQQERTKKALETRRKNHKLMGRVLKTAEKSTRIKMNNNQNNEDNEESIVDISGIKPFTSFKKGQNDLNLIKDLHNYFLRHDGDLMRKRNTFCFIMANYCKKVFPKEKCFGFISQYVSKNFYSELENIIEKSYDKPFYTFRYITIAALLGFDEIDIRESYGCFSKERKEQAKREKAKRQNEKRRMETKAHKDYWIYTKKVDTKRRMI